MIIATGSISIDENTKLAEDATDANESLEEKLENTTATLDGKSTVSDQAPFEDGTQHSEGDVWTVVTGDNATAMYVYTNGAWQEKQWDQETLSVKTLSALSANLGYVTSGTLISAIIKGATIEEDSENGTIKLDKDGFSATSGSSYFKFMATDSAQYTVAKGGIRADDVTTTHLDAGDINISGQTIQAYGVNTHVGAQGTWTYLSEGIKCGGGSYISPVSGMDIYFHNQSGSTIDIHAGDVISHGNKLSSALSVKRDVADYSDEEALAAVMNTTIKRWRYKDETNVSSAQHIGPVIDDVNPIGQKASSTADEMISIDSDGNACLNESNALSIALAALKEANKKIGDLSLRVTQLERKGL